jgi:hypothetical protein
MIRTKGCRWAMPVSTSGAKSELRSLPNPAAGTVDWHALASYERESSVEQQEAFRRALKHFIDDIKGG